jgi:hypothetical protein
MAVFGAPKVRTMPAQGNALGFAFKEDKALKGRAIMVPPIQGFDRFSSATQGVAGLAWRAPLVLRAHDCKCRT